MVLDQSVSLFGKPVLQAILRHADLYVLRVQLPEVALGKVLTSSIGMVDTVLKLALASELDPVVKRLFGIFCPHPVTAP